MRDVILEHLDRDRPRAPLSTAPSCVSTSMQVAVVLDHAGDPPHLPLDPREAA